MNFLKEWYVHKYRGIPYEQREKDWIDIHDNKPPLQYKVEIK
jgi:hypothetical protein